MNKRKRMMLLAAILVIGGFAFYFFFIRNNDQDGGDIPVSGNIEVTTVDVAFKIPGKIEKRLVDEGDRVKEGQMIATLRTRTSWPRNRRPKPLWSPPTPGSPPSS